MKKTIFFALLVLAAPLLLFRETSAQNKSNVAVLQYYSDPTGIACVSSSPLIGYASSIYSCQSSVYALYTISGGTTPTGPAGGDLGGTYPNPTALKTNGVSFGTAATVNTGTSGATIPLFNGANTWAGVQTYTSDVVATGIKSQGGGTNGADIELPSTGAVLSRNTADANPALVVQNTNTSNTGAVVNFKFGATTVASINKGGVYSQAVNAVASSATPAFDLSLGKYQTNTLTANITSFTITNIATGGEYCLDFIQNATGSFTISSPPASLHGFFTTGATASKHNVQCFYSPDGTNLYAQSAGQTNQ